MSDPTSPAGHTHTIYDGKTLREVIQMCEQAHACANELQRQLSETQQLCVELEEERDRLRDICVVTESRLSILSQELAAAQATIKQQGAVIAAIAAEMQTIYREGMLPDGDGVSVPTALWAGDVFKRIAKLAADHDASVRADERRKVLEEALEIVGDAVDGEPIQPDEIERRIGAL